ncbi:MAG: Xaa-Pro peptidase family protein [Planctomycetota bacterium]|nr:Xaa-Pro peptidase family protein [Planctomycetota bacterium]
MTSKKTSKSVGPAHLAARVKALQGRMKKLKADALLVTNPRDIRYLTGFIGDDSWALVPTRGGKVTVLSDFRFEEQIAREAPHVAVRMRKTSLGDELAELRQKLHLKRINVQPDYMTLAQHDALADKVGKKRLRGKPDGLIRQRAVKDAAEITAIRKSLVIQQEAFQRIIHRLKPGPSESAVAAELEMEMRMLGADGTSFPSIVAFGANACLPHAIPGQRRAKAGEVLLFDWGSRYHGYCSDLTRVVAIGKMSSQMREVYSVVLEAQMAAIAAIAPGKRLKDIDKVARDIIAKAGYGDRFGHGLGHGAII